MRETDFYNSIYNIVENLLQCELRNTSKVLLKNYVAESNAVKAARKARDAIKRYTGKDLLTISEIREKSKNGELEALDHLILKMEFIAKEGPA